MLYNKQIIAWKHDERIPSRHLIIEHKPADAAILGSFSKIHCDAQYSVSIKALKDDIKYSVTIYLEDQKQLYRCIELDDLLKRNAVHI